MAGLFSFGLSPDEALFATWARLINTGRDPFLMATAVDKPPLLFYLQAFFSGVLDSAEISPLLPNLFASILLIPLTFTLVKKQFGDHNAAMLSALLVAISPYLVAYSASAFTDPLALTLFVVSLVALSLSRVALAGSLFALSLSTRFPIVLLSPLLGRAGRNAGRFLAGVLSIGLLVGGWLLITQGDSWLQSGDARLVGGLRPISSWELLPRLNVWHSILDHAFGFSSLLLIILIAMLIVWRGAAMDRYYLAFALLFFAFHWLFATALYDRYMMPLVWLICLLLARAVSLTPRWQFRRINVQMIVLAVVLAGPTLAGFGKVGEDSADAGTAALQHHFADDPYGTVLYDHWYTWQSRYYLFDSRVHVAWVAHPDDLIDNLAVFHDDRRYIILPDDRRSERFHRALTLAGYHLEKRLQSGEMSVYKIGR